MKKKSFALLLMLLLVASLLAACGGGNGNGAESEQPVSDFVYQAQYVDLPADISYMNSSVLYGDSLYFYSYGKTGTREPQEGDPQPGDDDYYEGYYDIYSAILSKVDLDGQNYTVLPDYQPPLMCDGATPMDLSNFTVDKDGNIWVAENGNTGHMDENDNWIEDDRATCLRKLDNNGAELVSIDISHLAEETDYFYISNIKVDNEGNLYISDNNTTIWVFDSAGQQLFSVSVSDWINSIVQLADGRIAATLYEVDKMVMKPIDVAAKDWGAVMDMPYEAYDLFSGGGDYDFYYRTSTKLIGYDIETQTETQLIDWIDSDIDSDTLGTITPLPDGRIVCTVENRRFYSSRFGGGGMMETDGSLQLVVLTKTPRSEVTEKTILTMATMYMGSELRSAVIEFNKTNPDYRIKVLDYSEFNTDDDYQAGVTKLNTEIISGQIPDILDVSELPVRQYAAKGILEDLYPYLDADPELGRDKLVASVLQALEIDGKLYQTAANFYIYTMIGATPVVGEELAWTMEEMTAALAQHPGMKAFANMSRSDLLEVLCMLNMNNYVDWQNGQCHFDSPEFISTLEFAATMPEEVDWEGEGYVDEYTAVQEGQLMLYPTALSDFERMSMFKQLFGGEITYKGFPTDRDCGSVFGVNEGLAMSSRSEHKDGVWAFLRILLTEKFATQGFGWAYPINKAAFDKMVEAAMEKETYTDDDGNVVEVSRGSWGISDGKTIEMYAATQEEIDQVTELIEAIDTTMNYDMKMMEVILEEAGPFFAGQKSAAETAGLIQNRVNIYINEQR